MENRSTCARLAVLNLAAGVIAMTVATTVAGPVVGAALVLIGTANLCLGMAFGAGTLGQK